MQLSKMKNIIVLKGMASNIVDEAIVVLKPNIKINQNEYSLKQKYKCSNKNKKIFIKKEAENTINLYVDKLQKDSNKFEEKKFKVKYKFLKICNIFLILSFIIAVLIKI